MGRIIINNESDATDIQAVDLVHRVMKHGRISGNQYCFATTYEIKDITGTKRYVAYSSLNKKSDSFKIINDMNTSKEGE